MTVQRRYLSSLDAGGRMVIIKSDGSPIATDEKQVIDKAVTRWIRNESLRIGRGLPDDAEFLLPGKMHPTIELLKKIINEREYELTMLSNLLGRRAKAVSEWLREVSKPYHTEVWSLFRLLGYRQMAIPESAVAEVEELIRQHEKDLQDFDAEHSMGE